VLVLLSRLLFAHCESEPLSAVSLEA
jgi:hypothetical protein